MELIDVILSKGNLNRAYKKVVANKGASGVDGVTVAFFSGWHAGGKSIFLADAITDTAEFMITAFIGNILVMVNEAGSIEDDVVMNVIFVNMGTDYVFIFSFQHFICKLLS